MPFPLLIALGARLLGPLIGGVAKNITKGGQKDANDPARAQREANDIARRQNDITAENNRRVNDINAENNKRQNDRADKITDHEISQDKRQNRIDDEERARDNKFEDEDRDVVRKQRERDEKVLQTSDDNDFIIRADFVKKAGALLKTITFGEFNIVVASGVSKDTWTVEPEGEIFSDVITVQLGGGTDVMYEVRIFESGTLVRNGSLERDAFFIWPKPTKKNRPAIPTGATKPQIPGPIGLMAGRMGPGVLGLIGPMLVTAALAGVQKRLEEEKAKPGADQNALATALTDVRTFEFEELKKRHEDWQFERRLQRMADEMKGADAEEVVEELDENEEAEITEPVVAKGKKKSKKSSRAAPQADPELEGDDREEEFEEQPVPPRGKERGTKARRAGREPQEFANDDGVEEANGDATAAPRKAKKSLSSRVKNKTRQAQPEQDQGGDDVEEEDGQDEAPPPPQPRKKATTKKAGRR